MTIKKKPPRRYPQFAFRISQPKLEPLQDELQDLAVLMNKGKAAGEPLTRGNDVAFEAIWIGLKQMRAKLTKK